MTHLPAVFRQVAELKIGAPQSHGGITVVPLVGPHASVDGDLPLGAAIADGSAVVEELPHASVGEVLVVNTTVDRHILGIGGEMVLGGRQDRAVNASFVIPPRQRVAVAVSCVEQHRWSGDRRFLGGGILAATSVRTCLSASTCSRVTTHESRVSDQGMVWRAVADIASRRHSASPSDALRRVYDVNAAVIDRSARAFALEPGQTGVALLRGGAVVSLDVFAAPTVLAHYFPRLVASAVAEGADDVIAPEASDDLVRQLLARLAEARVWTEVAAIGGSSEVLPSVPGYAVSALHAGGRLRHLTLCQATEPPPVSVAPAAQGDALALRIRLAHGPEYHVGLACGRISVGRSAENALQLRSAYVSRRHAELGVSEGCMSITDLGSANGVTVNGRAVRSAVVRPGDHVTIGKAVALAIAEGQ